MNESLVVVLSDGTADGDRLAVTDTSGLAELLRGREYGDYEVVTAYALNHRAELVQVNWTLRCGPFDERQFADVTVTVTYPDGEKQTASYQVDGAV